MIKQELSLIDFITTYPYFFDCAVQYFDDTQQWGMAWHRPMDTADFKRLAELNSVGLGIYFSVNSMEKWYRDQKHVTRLNSWIVECDILSKEEQRKLIEKAPIRPSCIIESKKSYHIYYFIDGKVSIRNRKTVCKWLRDYYSWDNSVIDISRVLRLPDFHHCKDWKYMVKCVWLESSLHKESNMAVAFPYTAPVTKPVTKCKVTKKTTWWWVGIRDKASNTDNMYILSKISWTHLMSWENIDFKRNNNWTRQIIVNWKVTWCRITKDLMIGSKDWWWPTRIQWVLWYWVVNKTELYRWIKTNIDLF